MQNLKSNHSLGQFSALVLTLALSAHTGWANAQTLGELAAAQSVKQSLELKKTKELALSNRAGSSAGVNHANYSAAGQVLSQGPQARTSSATKSGHAAQTSAADAGAKPIKGPVVHSITQRGDTLRIELADKGRLMVARVGMQFGSKQITALSSLGVTIIDTPSTTNTTTNNTAATTATASTAAPVQRVIALGGAL